VDRHNSLVTQALLHGFRPRKRGPSRFGGLVDAQLFCVVHAERERGVRRGSWVAIMFASGCSRAAWNLMPQMVGCSF